MNRRSVRAFLLSVLLGLTSAVGCGSPGPTPAAQPTEAALIPSPQVVEITPTPWVITATAEPSETPTSTTTSTNTSVPVPSATAAATMTAMEQWQNYLQSRDAQEAINQYANAMGVNPEGVTARLQQGQSDLVVKGVSNISFEIRVDPQTGMPIFVGRDGDWKVATPDVGIKTFKGEEFFAGASLGGSDIAVPESMDASIMRQFSANTLEGWHWKYLEPSEGGISSEYQSWDSWMINRYASQILTGHPLYFPANNPDWLQGKSNEELLRILESHIKGIVQTNGKIMRWIVVNEPNEPTFPDIYHQRFGDDIYLKMFQWAHEANPDATLILNDYSNDHPANPSNSYGNNTAKTQDVLLLLKKDTEVYTHVHVGMQMDFYTDEPPDVSRMLSAIAQYALPVDITELTVTQSSNEKATQPDIYKMVGEVIRRAENIRSVTFWGIGNTKKNMGITIFSENQPNQPNRAYYYFLAGLLNPEK